MESDSDLPNIQVVEIMLRLTHITIKKNLDGIYKVVFIIINYYYYRICRIYRECENFSNCIYFLSLKIKYVCFLFKFLNLKCLFYFIYLREI